MTTLQRPCLDFTTIPLFLEAEEIEGDFMYSANGRAFSEVQLQSGDRSLSRESIDSGYHPIRKSRSSPIKQSSRKNGSRTSLNRSGEDLRHVFKAPDRNNNSAGSYDDHSSLLSLQTKVGLFAGKGSEQDVGPSARRLRGRGSNSNVSKGIDDSDHGSMPLGFSSPNGGSSLKKFKTTESLLDLNQAEIGSPSSSFFYQENGSSSRWSIDQHDSKKAVTTMMNKGRCPSSDSLPRPNALSKLKNTTNSLPRKLQRKSDSFLLDDLSEDEISNRVWRLSEDSDTSLSSNTSGASKSSVKFRFNSNDTHGNADKRRMDVSSDEKDYYSKSNLSLIIRNRLAGTQMHKSNTSIARGTTIVDALKLEKKDSMSSAEGGVPPKRSAPIRMRPTYRTRGSLSSSSTDSANVIENLRFSHGSPPSTPSLPSSLSSVPSSEEATRKPKETLASLPIGTRKRVPSVNGSLVISRI